ncbi:uncharacterized protein GIQ15_03315 [Arthroderma uncinatum]|uniref:uncharacterized protein n=1 Tax=Arthroderma uncinatum TaxID=74035 RepID=UPI00144AA056|nr:uncharacterized protein GIQ15_03315 [Arthroderma uncinatum]KAF3483991.1 hypothetical protein GIQ15_03315 [Arthroderma uncinatum]
MEEEEQGGQDGRDTKQASLMTLPSELILLIAENLQMYDVNSLLQCNSRLHGLLNIPLYRRDAQDESKAIGTATRNSDIDLTRRILDAGLNPNSGWSETFLQDHLLFKAVKQRCNARDGTFNETELAAFFAKNYLLIEYLVSQGANVNNFDQPLCSPFRYIVANGDINLVRLFLENGADVSAKDGEGTGLAYVIIDETQIDNPSNAALLETLRLLFDHKLDPNVVDSWGHTPLHYHIYRVGCSIAWTRMLNRRDVSDEIIEEILKILLEYGADINARDELGETPLSLAMDFVQDEPICAKLLLLYGADTSLVALPTDAARYKAALEVRDEVRQITGRDFVFLDT